MPASIFIPQSSNGTGFPLQRQRLDVQCEQIFQRASSINKEFIHRVQNAPIAKKHVFGLEIRKIWMLLTLLFLFSCSLLGTILFWFTDTVDTFLMKQMAIVNGTDGYDGWIHPKPRALLQVHIFNYTNIDNFEKGIDQRLRVQDLGPYVYEEIVERQNVHFEGDGTVSFQNVYKQKYLPHLSKGKPNDIVVVPNIMVLAAAYKTRDMDYWARFAAYMTLGSFMNNKPFMKLAAHRFIWGYEDSVYNIAKGFMAFQNSNMQDQIGLMSVRNGSSPYVLTMQTGQRDMRNYGTISRVNGFDAIGHWSNKECDSLTASDGTLFPPHLVRSKQDLKVYLPDACRKFPLVFEKEILIINNTVPAYRYKLPESIFDAPDKEPANLCYCDAYSGICPPQGFYNLSQCTYGAPFFMSRPHFKNVNQSDIKVDGVNSEHVDASSYVDLHPVMGFPLAGLTKLQFNILAKKYPGFYSMDMFGSDGVMLPLGWFQSGLEEKYINREYLEVIYFTTFTIKQVEMAIKYVTLLTTLITVSAIIIILKARLQSHRPSDTLQRQHSSNP